MFRSVVTRRSSTARTSEYQPGFARFEFTTCDFEKLPLLPGDFVYADPPYDVEFTHYSKGGFNWDAQARAAEWLAKHPGPVVLSNQRTERIEKLYKKLGYQIRNLTELLVQLFDPFRSLV